MLDIVADYHRIQFKGKSKIQTQQNDENPHFGPDLGPLPPYSGHHFFPKIYLRQSLHIIVSYHHV